LARVVKKPLRLTTETTSNINIFASRVSAARVRLGQFRIILVKTLTDLFLTAKLHARERSPIAFKTW